MDVLGPDGVRLAALLDDADLRHRVIAANLANVNTPGYRAQEVSFDRALGKAVVREREGVTAREDGHTVVMEIEVQEMRKNALVYRVFLQGVIGKTRLLRSAISGRNA